MLREHDICPLVKYHEFGGLDKEHNARLDDDLYHCRSVTGCSFRVLRQRHGDRLCTRTWYGQFRELVLKVAVKNVDNGIGTSHC